MISGQHVSDHIVRKTTPASLIAHLERRLEQKGLRHSRENLSQLLDVYTRSPSKIVSFVGAGTSLPLRIKDWPCLLKSLLLECSDKLQAKYADLIEDPEGAGYRLSEKFPTIADEICTDVGGQQQLSRLIEREMELKECSCTPTLQFLTLALSTHLTTNFDRAIEKAHEFVRKLVRGKGTRGQLSMSYCHNLSMPPSQPVDWLYYLHADPDNKMYIIRETHYKEFYEDSGSRLYRALESFYYEYSIVFVGFSFMDQYVDNLFRRFAQESRH